MNLPENIIKKVNEDFDLRDRDYVLEKLERQFNQDSTFGAPRVIRATLFLANGNRKQFEDGSNTDDFATILLHADKQSGHYGHYFSVTFEEIEEINRVMINQLESKNLDYENLPPDLFENDFKVSNNL